MRMQGNEGSEKEMGQEKCGEVEDEGKEWRGE